MKDEWRALFLRSYQTDSNFLLTSLLYLAVLLGLDLINNWSESNYVIVFLLILLLMALGSLLFSSRHLAAAWLLVQPPSQPVWGRLGKPVQWSLVMESSMDFLIELYNETCLIDVDDATDSSLYTNESALQMRSSLSND